MRKMMLLAAFAALKLGCVRLHAPASARPETVNKSSTPPLGLLTFAVPFALKKNGNRASRTGPLAATKNGMVLVAPLTVPLAITWLCGFGPTFGKMFADGLVPPGAGCEWQPPHPSRLNRGPRPKLSPVTVWFSLNWPRPVLKNAKSLALALTEANGLPAFTPVLLRTPGSVCANAIPAKNSTAKVTTDASLTVLLKIPPCTRFRWSSTKTWTRVGRVSGWNPRGKSALGSCNPQPGVLIH